MVEIIEQLKKYQHQINLLKDKKDFINIRAEISQLEQQVNQPDFWNDQKTAVAISKKLADWQTELKETEELESEINDLLFLAQTANENSLADQIRENFHQLNQRFENWEIKAILNGQHDSANAIVTIFAGAGGDDAQDWAQMLERMYLRFAENNNWTVDYLSRSPGMETGIKSTTFKISGAYAYGYLKAEAGVHRLVRISPFDADHARHTSFAMVEILPELAEAEIKIKPEDLKIETYRSSGHGGQSVNTTDSAVRITHLPTGLQAMCQNERSQQQNKNQALSYLMAKLQQYYETEQEDVRQALKGEYTEAAWGNQIRSYVLHPYKMVKDHRTDYQSSDPDAILSGDLMPLIKARLHQQVS